MGKCGMIEFSELQKFRPLKTMEGMGMGLSFQNRKIDSRAFRPAAA
jgi:hypothetical protein